MKARIGVMVAVVLALAIGARVYFGASGPHANELLDQLPDDQADEITGKEMPDFPTTFPSNLPVPTPEMTPEEAVRTVVAALRDNDVPTPQSGVATTFNFASPGNKVMTGPLARFAAMVHMPAYAPLLNHAASRVNPPKVEGNLAVLQVDITDRAGSRWVYLWQLSKQPDGTWMTDGVQPIAPGAEPKDPKDNEPKIGT